MCGIGDESGMNFYAWTVVKTQLMARARSASPERSIHFHIVVDSSMADLVADRPRLLRTHPGIADVVDYIRNHTTNVQLSLYLIRELEAIAVRRWARTSPPSRGSSGPAPRRGSCCLSCQPWRQ